MTFFSFRIVHGQKRCGILVRRYCNDLLTRLKPIQNPIIFGEKEICVPKIEEIQEDELPPLISLEEEEEKPPG